MATGSSLTVALRALIMLACLIVIPLIALFGNSLPNAVKSVVNGRWQALSEASCATTGFPPQFVPLVPNSPNGSTLPGPMPGILQSTPTTMPLPPRSADSGPNPPMQGVVPAGYEATVGPAPAFGEQAARSGLGLAEKPDLSQAPMGSPGDRFSLIQARLRQLGATYVLLETWGNQQELYRFYCKIAVGGNPNYTQYFEATDADHLAAASRVLQEVETWRASRQ